MIIPGTPDEIHCHSPSITEKLKKWIAMKHSKKRFLNLPEYPGGKEAFKAYIKSNLKYPEEALRRKIEGIVHLKAEIDDNGHVGNVVVEKGLGAGCDEEAVRLIKNVRFGGVKNRGVRVKNRKKFRVEFKLPPEKRKIVYQMKKPRQKPSQEPDKSQPETYTYHVQLKN